MATPDDQQMLQDLINDVNRRGGILGHPIQAIFHSVDVSQSAAQYEQSACDDFTQDHHVLVATGTNLGPDYLTCMTHAKVPVVGADWSYLNEADYQQLRWVLQPDAIAFDRLAQLQGSQFAAMGFFGSPLTAKIGILYWDEPHAAAAFQTLKATLAREGYQVAAQAAIHEPTSTQDLGETESGASGAELKFRAQGVTHVIAIETNAWLIGFFAIAAEQQDYYPLYGFTSDEVLTNLTTLLSTRALQGSRFIGWWPAQDITDTKQYSPGAQACLAYATAHGQPTSTGNEHADLLADCETVQFLVASISAGGSPISATRLVAGAQQIGVDYPSVDTFKVDIAAHADGVSAIRQGAYQTSCSCFVYTSDNIPVN